MSDQKYRTQKQEAFKDDEETTHQRRSAFDASSVSDHAQRTLSSPSLGQAPNTNCERVGGFFPFELLPRNATSPPPPSPLATLARPGTTFSRYGGLRSEARPRGMSAHTGTVTPIETARSAIPLLGRNTSDEIAAAAEPTAGATRHAFNNLCLTPTATPTRSPSLGEETPTADTPESTSTGHELQGQDERTDPTDLLVQRLREDPELMAGAVVRFQHLSAEQIHFFVNRFLEINRSVRDEKMKERELEARGKTGDGDGDETR